MKSIRLAMRDARRGLAVIGMVLQGVFRLAAQECDHLRDATSDELVLYLNGVVRDRENAECLTFAINTLGKQRYAPAVSVLATLLDFRRPPSAREKEGLYLHIQGIDEVYPAARALEDIGRRSLPGALGIIKERSASATARENAVFVWMEIHKYESPKGVALLKQEADKAEDATTRLNLRRALSRAVAWCNPQDEAQCKVAAQAGRLN
jgi:hypothetical protein